MKTLTVNGTLTVSPENAAELLSHPLMAAPPELRSAIYTLWIINQHLFPSPMPLSARFGIDTADGLLADDAKSIIGLLMAAEQRSKFKFAGDFLQELDRLIGLAIARRRKEAEQLKRRAEYSDEQSKASGLPASAKDFIRSVT